MFAFRLAWIHLTGLLLMLFQYLGVLQFTLGSHLTFTVLESMFSSHLPFSSQVSPGGLWFSALSHVALS